MRYVFYAFLAVAIGLYVMNHTHDGKRLKNELTANHEPEWKRM